MNKTFLKILKTLCYADIFDYPLTLPELYRYLITTHLVSTSDIKSFITTNSAFIDSHTNYFFLKNRKAIVAKRERRASISRKKIKRAIMIAGYLSFIPTIKLIGISGSLSMMNAKNSDDIDLFFITRKNTLWITRFIVYVLLLLLKVKRTRFDKSAKDKICANMFLTEDSLRLTHESIFIAHEVVQLRVVLNRDCTYEKFMEENKWVKKYLANTPLYSYTNDKVKVDAPEKMTTWKEYLIYPLESFFYYTQYVYMKSHKTNEIIGRNVAFFHPTDKTNVIEELYSKRYQSYLEYLGNLPTFHRVNKRSSTRSSSSSN